MMDLERIFLGIDQAKIGIIGDFCIDIYWRADMKRSLLSRETPHYPLPVVEERMSPGGAGNVACNVAALQPKTLSVFGSIGADWRGIALKSLLEKENMDVSGLIVSENRVTNAYCKPLRCGISDVIYEDPRLDFENYEKLDAEAEDKLIEMLKAADLDVLCVCDQMTYGCVTEKVRGVICELGKKGMTVIADSRDRIGLYEHVIVKPNEVEAMRALGKEMSYPEIAKAMEKKTHRPAIVTLGPDGCLVCEKGAVKSVPACKAEPPLDICGAGDTFLSAMACALAAGCDLETAAQLGNLASSVTIQKLHVTGTASRDELRSAFALNFN